MVGMGARVGGGGGGVGLKATSNLSIRTTTRVGCDEATCGVTWSGDWPQAALIINNSNTISSKALFNRNTIISPVFLKAASRAANGLLSAADGIRFRSIRVNDPDDRFQELARCPVDTESDARRGFKHPMTGMQTRLLWGDHVYPQIDCFSRRHFFG